MRDIFIPEFTDSAKFQDEIALVDRLIDEAGLSIEAREDISRKAADLVRDIRSGARPGAPSSGAGPGSFRGRSSARPSCWSPT